MYKPTPEKLKRFWSTLQDVWLKLYGSGFPTAAAINVSIKITGFNCFEVLHPSQTISYTSLIKVPEEEETLCLKKL